MPGIYRMCRPVVQEEYRSAGFSPEKSEIGTKTLSVPTESHETAMKTQGDNLTKFSNPNNTQVRKCELSRSTQDALLRLAANPQDACALVTVYDEYGDDLKASATRWFGRGREQSHQKHLGGNCSTGEDLRSAIHGCRRMGSPLRRL